MTINIFEGKYRKVEERKEAVYGSIVSFLHEYTEEEVTPDSRLKNDLGLDSISLFTLISEFEDRFGLEISDEDLNKIYTVKDVAALFEG